MDPKLPDERTFEKCSRVGMHKLGVLLEVREATKYVDGP
jgi:hypothetical protein